jgi:hypothetical protein
VLVVHLFYACSRAPHCSIMPSSNTFSSWLFGFKCFFGGAGCDSKCGVRGTMFVLMYSMGYVGTVNLARFSEGATFVAIVNVSYCSNYI